MKDVKKEFRLSQISRAKELLEKEGYLTSNLWHIDDVLQSYDVDKEEALSILEEAMTGDWVTGQIFECIDIIAEAEGHNKKGSDDVIAGVDFSESINKLNKL